MRPPVTAHLRRVAVWLMLGIVTLEVCARTEDTIRYGAPLWAAYDDQALYTFGPEGRRGLPNASYLKWKLNEAGFRGPALRSGTRRIVCLGASETFGLYEAEGGEWPRRLERELAGAGPLEVVNAAYPGIRLAHNLRQLDAVLELEPEMVLIYPSYAGYIEADSLNAPAGARIRRKPKWRPRLLSRLGTLLKATTPVSLQDELRKRELQRADRSSPPVPRLPESTIARFAADLEKLVAELRGRGIPVVVITHATRFGETVRPEEQPFLRAWRKFCPMLAEDGFLDMEKRMRTALLRVCGSAGVPVIDAHTGIEPGPVNFADFSHFTDRGAQAFAALIARDLRTLYGNDLTVARRLASPVQTSAAGR